MPAFRGHLSLLTTILHIWCRAVLMAHAHDVCSSLVMACGMCLSRSFPIKFFLVIVALGSFNFCVPLVNCVLFLIYKYVAK
jgi:hypothetical protein